MTICTGSSYNKVRIAFEGFHMYIGCELSRRFLCLAICRLIDLLWALIRSGIEQSGFLLKKNNILVVVSNEYEQSYNLCFLNMKL